MVKFHNLLRKAPLCKGSCQPNRLTEGLLQNKIVLISQPYGCALRTMDSPTG